MADKIEVTKTGECLYLDDNGNLCLAESFIDNTGSVSTEIKILEAFVEPEEK